MANAAPKLTREEAAAKSDRLVALLERGAKTKARPATVNGGTKSSPNAVYAEPRDSDEERRMGFKNQSEYCLAVVKAGMIATHGGDRDPRLKYERLNDGPVTKSVSGMSEGVGADGGFLIPPEFSTTIWMRVYENDLIKRTDRRTCTGNTMALTAVDESSRVNGSRFGGVYSYWLDEGGQVTQSQPKIRRVQFHLQKLACFGYITDEMLEDSQNISVDQWLNKLFAEEIEFRIGDAIYEGTGVGMPLGITNAQNPAQIVVAKETNQAAQTIVLQNIVKMWARLWIGSKKNAVWLINQDVSQQLYQLALNVGVAGVSAYLPPGGLSSNPYGTLMGRPVLEIEFAQTLGTQGDICLTDLSQYVTMSKAGRGGTQSDVSMHLRFQYDEMAYRTLFRVDGRSMWNTALTPFHGTNTVAPVVVLGTRA